MLELKDIHIQVGDFKISSVSLTVEKGDYFVVAGPSGAGKTILLETIAGLIGPSKGTILLNGRDISRIPSGKRSIGLVFQDNTAFPHLSVRKNILFALRINTLDKQRIENELQQVADNLGIRHLMHRKPSTLSGGELQRVVLARTLASKPQILLLDEPLSSVDAAGKDQLKTLLRNLNRKGQTIIHVTHDFDEAISLATKVGIMNSGKLIEQGTTDKVFHHPTHEFTARFCGYRNFFYAENLHIGQVMIDNKVLITIGTSKFKSEKLALIIPEEKIEISELPIENKAVNTFKASITDITHNRNGFVLEADFGVKLYIQPNSELLLKNQISLKNEIWLKIEPSVLKIIEIN